MKKQGFIHGSIILMLSVVVIKLIGALFKIPLANMLGGAGMGYFSSAYGLFMPIYAIAVTGLPTAIAKLTAENAALECYTNVRKIKKISLIIFALIGLISAFLIYILASPFSVYVVENSGAYTAVVLIAPSIFFGCVMSVYRGYYEGLRNMYPTAVSQVVEALVKLIAGLGLCYYTLNAGYSLPLAAGAAVLGVTMSSFAGMIYLIIRDKFIGDGITPSDLGKRKVTEKTSALIGSLMKIVIPVAIGSLVTNLTSLIDLGTIIRCINTVIEIAPETFSQISVEVQDTPNFIYGSFIGLSVTIFNLIPSFTNMFGKGILPNLAEAWSIKDALRIKKLVESVLMITAVVAIPAGIGITVLSEEILTFLYKSRSDEILIAYPALQALGIGIIFLSLTTPIFAMLQAIGRADIPVKLMILGVTVKLGLNLLLIPIPNINIVGAGISTTVCYAVICISAIVAICKEMSIKSDSLKPLFKPLYAGILCGGSALLTCNITNKHMGNNAALITAIGVGGLVYLLALYLFGVIPDVITKEGPK